MKRNLLIQVVFLIKITILCHHDQSDFFQKNRLIEYMLQKSLFYYQAHSMMR